MAEVEPTPFAIEADLSIYPMLAELRECLCSALGGSRPCFCQIVVGNEIPVDYVGGDCDHDSDDLDGCGVAYVRVVGAYPTSRFPEAMDAPTCNTAMAYNLAVGVLRCTSVGEEDGGPVNQEDFATLQLQLLSDMKAIRRAIQCCFMQAFPRATHVMGTFTPQPQMGGVAGGEWPITVLENF